MNTYGSLSLTVQSPVQTFDEPLTLAETKNYLRLPELASGGEADDDMLNALIQAAREQAEILQGRDLVEKQWDLRLDGFWRDEIELRDPLVSVDLVKYKDSDGNEHTLAADTDYIVDTAKHPGVVMPPYNGTWPSFTPWPSSAVLIRFTTGALDPFPALLRPGMLLLISHWFHGRLPFETGANAVQEYPYAVTNCLSSGAIERAH